MKGKGWMLLLAMAGAAGAQTQEPVAPQQCIGYMERALMDTYNATSGMSPTQADWQGIRDNASRCGAWHAEHIDDPVKRGLFAKAYATYLAGIAAPSMNAIGTFGYDAMAYSTSP